MYTVHIMYAHDYKLVKASAPAEHVRKLFDGSLSQESESKVSVQEIYAVMRIKTHSNNALY